MEGNMTSSTRPRWLPATFAFALLIAGSLALIPASAATVGPTCGGRAATIVGTAGDDVIEGTAGPDVIVAKGGNDIIRGYGGIDRICGNAGRDQIYGGPGGDHIFGGRGVDTISAGSGNDRVTGGGSRDIVKGQAGDDVLRGNGGNDKLLGGKHTDTADGGAGTDECVAEAVANCEDSEPPQPECDPSYPTVCIPPPPPDLNCGDIPYRNFTVLQPDPHGFDGNKDGIGCES